MGWSFVSETARPSGAASLALSMKLWRWSPRRSAAIASASPRRSSRQVHGSPSPDVRAMRRCSRFVLPFSSWRKAILTSASRPFSSRWRPACRPPGTPACSRGGARQRRSRSRALRRFRGRRGRCQARRPGLRPRGSRRGRLGGRRRACAVRVGVRRRDRVDRGRPSGGQGWPPASRPRGRRACRPCSCPRGPSPRTRSGWSRSGT
jgi:hypothetical protein